jgi:hypothetical protein
MTSTATAYINALLGLNAMGMASFCKRNGRIVYIITFCAAGVKKSRKGKSPESLREQLSRLFKQ